MYCAVPVGTWTYLTGSPRGSSRTIRRRQVGMAEGSGSGSEEWRHRRVEVVRGWGQPRQTRQTRQTEREIETTISGSGAHFPQAITHPLHQKPLVCAGHF